MKDKKFVLLLVFFLLLRLYPIWLNNFPFNYDNAKDSLVIMQMWVFQKPALLGAVTSMEGLWQGPFWYYAFFPLNVLLRFHPIASVLSVVSLGAFTLWLFWKYLGKFEAFLYAISAGVITTQQTAWSPYLTMFSIAWILVLLKLLRKRKDTKLFILLSLSLVVMFHAEIAFGVVLTILLALILTINKLLPNPKQLLAIIISFFSLFIPQAIFELRHDFLQTRSVFRFIGNFQDEAQIVGQNEKGVARVWEVVSYFSENALKDVLPYDFQMKGLMAVVLIAIFVAILFRQKDKETRQFSRRVFAPTIFGSIVMYLFLPVKSYYLVGFAPVWILAVAVFVRNKIPKVQKPATIVFSLVAIINLIYLKNNYAKLSQDSKILYSTKLEAVNVAYEMSDNQPFNSYNYVAELYDYTYQHIYQYTSIAQNRPLPVDYAYAPGKPDYMLTEKLSSDAGPASHTILIVENDDKKELFDAWWNEVTTGKVIAEERKVNESITVYVLDDEKVKPI